jgi:DNA-binding NtrC family response regulator
VRAVKLGAAGYLPKPFTPDELMDAAMKALGGQGGRSQEPPPTAPATAKLPRRIPAGPPAHSRSREPIDVDLPFPEADVEQATDADYVASLDRSDIPRAALYGKGSEARHNVLVVDDEPVVCHSVRRILAKQGCAVEAAFDVDAVMQKLALNEYDLVLLDLKMPRRSGLEVLRSIRRQYPDVPVVMISGYGSIEDAVAAVRLGAAEFLQKPFTPEELMQVTGGILAQ